MYEVSAPVLARAIPVALITGAVMGVVWGLLLPAGLGFGFFALFIALILGSPIGYFVAGALDRVTNRKRGPVMQGIAVGTLLFAYLVRAAVAGGIVPGDLFSIVLLAAACAGAISRLR